MPVPKFPAQAKFGTLERLKLDESAAKLHIESLVRLTRRVATLQFGNPAKPKVSDQRSKRLRSTAQTLSLCLLRMWRHAATARRPLHKANQTRTSTPPPTATAFTAMPTRMRALGVRLSRRRIAAVRLACWRLSSPDAARHCRCLWLESLGNIG